VSRKAVGGRVWMRLWFFALGFRLNAEKAKRLCALRRRSAAQMSGSSTSATPIGAAKMTQARKPMCDNGEPPRSGNCSAAQTNKGHSTASTRSANSDRLRVIAGRGRGVP